MHKVSNDLRDLCILVTRPKPQGEELCARIEELGGKPIYLPTLEIVPIQDDELFRQQMKSLSQYDWLIFISPQAVFHSVAWIPQSIGIKFAAIGEGTKNALQAAGFTDITHPLDEWTSEGLLKLPCFNSVSGKKIMLVKGAGGRELLADTLMARGAIVTEWVVYRRVLPDMTVDPGLFYQQKIDIIICTSGESMRNLIKLVLRDVRSTPQDKRITDIFEIPLVVISPRLVQLARELGFKKVSLSSNASHNAIIETIKGISNVRN
jgi:uroporphyrinogen-III synthase